MKTRKFISILAIAALLIATACSDDENKEDTAPILPPEESLIPDFSAFTDNPAMAEQLKSSNAEFISNYNVARINVLVWNTYINIILAVPVAAYRHSFTQSPVYLGNKKWQWSYSLGGFFSDYSARLTGEIRTSDIKWEMRVSYSGAEPYNDFLWFEGTSDLDGSGGSWAMNHSYDFNEPMLTLDWEATDDLINDTRITYVRELDNDRETELGYGSYLGYGVNSTDNVYFYNVHVYDDNTQQFEDLNIEMNRTDLSGRIKATNWINNKTGWHCWDSNFDDVDCE
ncbi:MULTISPECIES: hypothetical protein [unclassified Saccharicrinis]|uniref:hypothetical protein n=1 Tax=unclassified Saccharicrinis TaxID=2646859 RepID=UPI003D34C657